MNGQMIGQRYAADDVEYTIECLPEDMPVRGNAMASGDDDLDRQVEGSIIDSLNSGNEWAWCMVKVTASWGGLTWEDYLGGCSYHDEADFKRGGYYESMQEQAREALEREIESAGWAVL